jgi:predicted extracellular nuclease
MSISKTYNHFIITITFLISIALSNSGGVGGNYANNAPNSSNCTSCHSGSANSGNGSVSITGLPSGGYTPGDTYSLTIKVAGTHRDGYGFQMASQVGNDNAGTFSLGASSQNAELSGNKVQQSARTISGEWIVEWLAPSSDVGDITFSASGLATGGASSNSGDNVYTASVALPAFVPQEVDLFFSEYSEGSSNNKYVEVYNPTGAGVDLSIYAIKGTNNGTAWGDGGDRNVVLSGTLSAGDVFIMSTDQSDQAILDAADLALPYESPVHYNGNDAIGLFKNDELIDAIGVELDDPGSGGWSVAGNSGATKDNTLIRKSTVTTGNTDWTLSAGTSGDDSEWIVEAIDYRANLGVHVYGNSGENILPIANAGGNQTVLLGSIVTLDGSSSVDPDGSIASFLWTQTAGATVSLSSTDVAEVTFTAPNAADSLSFTLQVTDDDGASSSETIYVKIASPSPIFFSEYAEGGAGYHKYLEIYNSSDAEIDLSGYAILGNGNGGPYNDTLRFDANTMLASQEVYVIAHAEADPIILAEADKVIANPFNNPEGDPDSYIVSFNGDDARAIAKIEGSEFNVIDIIGTLSGGDPGNGWGVAGVADGTKDHTLIRKSSISFGNADWASSAGTSADNSEWIVKDDLDWTNIGCHNAECVSTAPALSGLTASPAFLTNETEIELSVSITSEVGTIDESSVKVKFGTNDQLVNEAQLFLDAGNTYVGTIPAQQGNTKFQMRVSAKNSEGDEGQSDLVERLIASSTPNQISELYSNQTSDQVVTIKGIVTIGGSGLLYPTQTKAYLQDASGRGLQLFDFNIIEGLDRGDEIEVVGYAGYYQTTYQVKDFVFREISSGNNLPEPIEVTATQSNSSNYEGTLIAITGNITAITPVSTNGNNYTIDDATAVMIWNSTGIDVSTLTVGYRGKFVGVGSQYFEDYQLLVGYDSDISTMVGVDLNDIIVDEFTVLPAYPNPFNPVTNLSFVLDTRAEVMLKVYDVNGKLVEVSEPQFYQSGRHNIQWNAASLSSGMYFVHLLNGSERRTQKVMLLK